jgi:hypothetical protein
MLAPMAVRWKHGIFLEFVFMGVAKLVYTQSVMSLAYYISET